MTKTKCLRIVTGFTAFAELLGLVARGVMLSACSNMTKGVIVGDHS